MKHKGYRFAVQWIANNDETCDIDALEVSGDISVQLVADLYSKDPMDVAKAVVKKRIQDGH